MCNTSTSRPSRGQLVLALRSMHLRRCQRRVRAITPNAFTVFLYSFIGANRYGYVETKKKYTLQSFQRLAAKIKGNIVKGPRSRGQLLSQPLAELERQYWEAIASNNQSIAVECAVSKICYCFSLLLTMFASGTAAKLTVRAYARTSP